MAITFYSETPVYYGGFDPGSGEATLSLIPTDDVDLSLDIYTLPSLIADGKAEQLLGRGNLGATLAQVLSEGEYVLTIDGNDYFLGDLIREGRNATDALGDPNRYWSNHSQILLLALAALLIPERCFELRLVTALPVTLYNKDNREKVKQALEGYYHFSFSTKSMEALDREITVKVGYVGMEGQGILVHAGEPDGDQVVFDVGERTFDLLVADGQKLLVTRCHGNEELGVRLLVDDLQHLAKSHKKVLKIEKCHEILHAYANGETLPTLSWINEEQLASEIATSILRAGRALCNFISAHLTNDGENVAGSVDRVYLAGGGAYYFRQIIEELIEDAEKVIVVEDAELANARGYAQLATRLHRAKATIWEYAHA